MIVLLRLNSIFKIWAVDVKMQESTEPFAKLYDWNVEIKHPNTLKHFYRQTLRAVFNRKLVILTGTLRFFVLQSSINLQPICFQCTLFLPPENIRKPYGFLMFSGGREKVHWEQMGEDRSRFSPAQYFSSFRIPNMHIIFFVKNTFSAILRRQKPKHLYLSSCSQLIAKCLYSFIIFSGGKEMEMTSFWCRCW